MHRAPRDHDCGNVEEEEDWTEEVTLFDAYDGEEAGDDAVDLKLDDHRLVEGDQQETPQQETANNWLRSDSTFASSVISSGRNVQWTNRSSSTKPEPCEDALGAPALHHSKRRPAKLDSFLSRAIGDVASSWTHVPEDEGLCSLPSSRRAQSRDAAAHAG